MSKRKKGRTTPEIMSETFKEDLSSISEATLDRMDLLEEHVRKRCLGKSFSSADIYTIIIIIHALKLWSENRNIYRFDSGLLQEIKKMEDADIPAEALAPPFPCVYVDLHGQLKEYDGAFVIFREWSRNRNKRQKHIALCFVKGRERKRTFITLSAWIKERDGINQIVHELVNEALPYEDAMLILRIILYLSSSKPDIEKRQFCEGSKRSKKASQQDPVIEWDVGLRYTVEKRRDHVQSRNLQNNDVEKGHKRPRPHIRKAHWHLYWTGEGKQTPRVRWVQPMFINTGKAESIPVVVRKEE